MSTRKRCARPEAALQGACDIVAEKWSEDPETRQWLSEQAFGFGRIHSQVKRGKKEEAAKYEMYFDHQEPVKRIPSHRLLAMKRGEAEGLLKVNLELDDDFVLRKLRTRMVTNRQFEFHQDTARDGGGLLSTAAVAGIESATLQQLKEQADEEAIQVFTQNLRELLLAPPAGPRVTMGIDPAFEPDVRLRLSMEPESSWKARTIYPTPPSK